MSGSVPAGALIRDRRRSEQGTGRVLEVREGGFGLVAWPGATPQETRLEGQRDLVRARLHPGQRVRIVGEAPVEGQVLRSEGEPEPERLWSYVVAVQGDGDERVVAEAALEPLATEESDPLASLRALVWSGSRPFRARLDLLRTTSIWYENAFGIPPLLGARIVPLPHQIHAARRVLTDRVPRFVLADEVGLGKTIEAGLVLQALATARADLRVLVIAPGAMSRQWLCELFLRFGEQIFVHVDAPRLELPETLDLLGSSRLIVSTAALEAYPAAQEALLAERWDVVVVDEAHQVHPDTRLYRFLRELASKSWGLLALSATPAKGDLRGLLGLLGLVAPDVYDPDAPERFAQAFQAREEVATWLDATRGALASTESVALDWVRERAAALSALVPDDPQVAEFVARARGQGGASKADLEELLAYVQEYHRIDQRILRTRRATVQALGTRLCKRERALVEYQAPPAEKRLLEHIEAVPPADAAAGAASPLQVVLRGLYRRRACSAPLPLLAFLERRKQALEARAASAAPKPARKTRASKATKVSKAASASGGPAAFDPIGALGADPGPAEEEFILERVVREAPPLAGEAEWLAEAIRRTHAWMSASPDGCARTLAALEALRARRREKVLVFAQDREAVEAFADALRDQLGPDAVGAIHHGLDEHRLSEEALRFQQADGSCRVLVSDELGGEGRNFQLAGAVLHLDQPWAVGRLEQRIGRLDRIGRDASRAVRSLVLVGPGASERALTRLHSQALGVYERSLGGLEFLLPEVQREVSAAACEGPDALAALVAPLTARVAQERARADEAHERALDASARRLEEAAEQAEILAEVDGVRDAPSLAAWAKRVGISLDAIDAELWKVGWSWEHLRRVPAGLAPTDRIPEEGRVRRRGTFSRERALADESLELFGPGHPLIDALVRDLNDERDGRTAALTRNLGPDHRGHLYLLVVARTALADLELPEGLRYRAQAYLWPQVRTGAVRLHPGRTPATSPVTDTKLLMALETDDSSDRTLDRDDLAGAVDLDLLWAAATEGVAEVLERIRAEREAEVADAAQRLADELAHDLAYLRGAAKRASEQERRGIEEEIEARGRLVEAVRGERVGLEALSLVLGVVR